ncbi:MAG: DUF1127 domain-containing protein [Kiloniellaceae bacterium]
MIPTPRHQGDTTPSWFTGFADRLRRLGERRELREMLALRSDRLLADIGFSREQLATEIDAAVNASQQRREIERQTLRELGAYSDRELDDIGIRRDDIRRIAHEHARQASAFNRFDSRSPADTLRANDNAWRRASGKAA